MLLNNLLIINQLCFVLLFFACSDSSSNDKTKVNLVQLDTKSVFPFNKHNIQFQEKSSFNMKVIVVCNNTPLYLKPTMKSRKADSHLNRGDNIILTNKIFVKSKRSFDFGETTLDNKQYYVPLQYVSSLPALQNRLNGNIIIGEEIVDKENPLPLEYEPNDLHLLPTKHRAPGYKRRIMKLRKEALSAFSKMIIDAEKKGIEIKFISCFRSASYQENPYKRTIKAVGPKQSSSAKPGHSEHQLGTVGDVSTKAVGYRLTQSFAKTKAYRWIKQNAHQYGIFISYTKDNYKEKGYIWEPWHLRYWGLKLPVNTD